MARISINAKIRDILPELGALMPCDAATAWLEGHADVSLRALWSRKFIGDLGFTGDGYKLASWFKWLVTVVESHAEAADRAYYRSYGAVEELRAMRDAVPLRAFLDALEKKTR